MKLNAPLFQCDYFISVIILTQSVFLNVYLQSRHRQKKNKINNKIKNAIVMAYRAAAILSASLSLKVEFVWCLETETKNYYYYFFKQWLLCLIFNSSLYSHLSILELFSFHLWLCRCVHYLSVFVCSCCLVFAMNIITPQFSFVTWQLALWYNGLHWVIIFCLLLLQLFTEKNSAGCATFILFYSGRLQYLLLLQLYYSVTVYDVSYYKFLKN